MAASTVTLVVPKGQTFTWGWAVSFDPGTGVSAPIDNTWTAEGQIRETVDADAILYTLDVQVDVDGNVIFEIPHTDSTAFTWSKAKYGIEVTNAAGTIRLRVAQGTIKATDEVVR